MKVKELPENSELAKVKVELPDDVLKQYQNYAGGEKHMYILGQTMGDFFMSPDPPTKDGKGSRKLYPMPFGVNPRDILEWEVIL